MRYFDGMHTPITQKAKTKKKWALFFILALFVIPAYLSANTAKASVFDPLTKVVTPIYERIVKVVFSPNTPKTPPTPLPVPPNVDIDTANLETLLADNNPTPDLYALLTAEFTANRGDPKTALALYKSQAMKKNATAVFERALALSIQLESPKESLDFAKAWQDTHTDHIPAWFYITHLALKAEDYTAAAQTLRAILAYDPKADLSQIFAGILPSSPTAQQTLFQELQVIDSDNNASLSILKAGLLAQIGEIRAALLHIDNALIYDANNLAYLTLKADILKDHNNAKFHQFLTQIVKTTKGDTQKQLYLYHARQLIDVGDLTSAWQVLQNAHADKPSDLEIALLGSLVALDINEYKNARDLLSILADSPATKNDAEYYLGLSYERTQEYQIARSHFANVQSGQFLLPAMHKIVALSQTLNDTPYAIDKLVKLRRTHPELASENYTLHADILLKSGNTQAAKELLAVAYQNTPDDPSLLYASTQLLDDTQDYDEKLSNLEKLVKLEPDNLDYQLQQARLVLLKDPTDTKSLQIAQDVSTLRLDDIDYNSQRQLTALTLLAKSALAQKDYNRVLTLLQTPYEVAPTLPVGILLLRAYQGLGDGEQVQTLLAELTETFGSASQPANTSQDY